MKNWAGSSDDFADDSKLVLHVVTPEGALLDAAVDMVEFPSDAGEMGVLPGHAPLVAGLAAGEMRVYRQGRRELFAVAGGYVQVFPFLVRVVATFAATGDDVAEIDEACKRARQALETAAEEPPSVIANELAALRLELTHLATFRNKKRR